MSSTQQSFEQPNIVYDAKTESYINSVTGEATAQTQGVYDQASIKSRGLFTDQLETPNESLSKDYNANYAKDGGQYGRFNNKDYRTTLRLAREADAYNAGFAPTMMTTGYNSGGGVDIEQVQRPKLETMETRAMEQAERLDTNQKELAQELQNAINHKNLDAFKQLYTQLYGIQLSSAAAKSMLYSQLASQKLANTLAKNLSLYQTQLARYMSADTAQRVMQMAIRDPLLGQMVASAFGLTTPSMQQLAENENVKQAILQITGNSTKSYLDLTPDQQMQVILTVYNREANNAKAQSIILQGQQKGWKINKIKKELMKQCNFTDEQAEQYLNGYRNEYPASKPDKSDKEETSASFWDNYRYFRPQNGALVGIQIADKLQGKPDSARLTSWDYTTTQDGK